MLQKVLQALFSLRRSIDSDAVPASRASTSVKATLSVEPLEQRVVLSAFGTHLSDFVDVSQIPKMYTRVTIDAPSNHLTSAFEGVARLDLTLVGGGSNVCGGTLLPTGRHVLTAAHCLTNAFLQIDVSSVNVVFFPTAGGQVTRTVTPSGYSIHPNYGGIFDGDDLAILTLPSPVTNVERHDIYRGDDEIEQLFVVDLIGYGESGQLTVDPQTYPAGPKRLGQNRFEMFWAGDEKLLIYDFDDGNPENDTIGNTYPQLADVGLGNAEVLSAPGDSGSPGLVNGKIVGLSSFVGLMGGGSTTPAVGHLGAYVRVSRHAAWIDSVVDIIGPRVIDIDVGSTVAHSTFHPDYDVPVGSNAQTTTIPVADVNQFIVRFNENVTIDRNDFSLKSAITGSSYALAAGGAGFNYNPNTFTATFTLANVMTQPDQVILGLSGSYDPITGNVGVTDISGNFLDGEWQNVIDTFATGGDDSPGGDFAFHLTVLPGDGNRGNWVEQADLDLVLGNWGMQDAKWINGDTNGDGEVEQGDLDDVLLYWGTDFRNWPSGGSLMGFTQGPSKHDLQADFLAALDESLSRLGLGEVWDSLHVKESAVLATEASLDAFMERLARELDSYHGVKSG